VSDAYITLKVQTMKHIFLINLGPVQEFIASARRSRDLWYGSWLISELAKTAARVIAEKTEAGVDSLVFPAPVSVQDLQPDSPFSAPNKILAVLNAQAEEIRSLASDIQMAIYARLRSLWDEARGQVHGPIDEDTAKKQIEDLPEYYWVAVPLNEDYIRARQEAEALMSARKATRDFAPVTWRSRWGDGQPKSSLDGLRESVIPDSAYPSMRDDQDIRRRKIRELYNRYRAGQAERLSGVDLLKRLGRIDAHFPGTPHIAAMPLLKGLMGTNLDVAKEAWHSYLDILRNLNARLENDCPEHPVTGRYDGVLLFESRLQEVLEEADNGALAKAREALYRFLDTAAGKQRPLPYYAILVADGDSMGKVIDAQSTMEDHRRLSRALDSFAREVRSIVEGEGEGALVYAGGDDVLAFVPLHTILTCARRLADTFKQHMSAFRDADGRQPTMSAGVAITHYMEPLSDALALARHTERAAKGIRGKDALAITVRKRSGFDTLVRGHWGELDKCLQSYISLYLKDAVPDGAAYELRELALRAGGVLPHEALASEVERILRRKRTDGTKPMSKEVLDLLTEEFKQGAGLRHFADELIVARDLASAAQLAGMGKGKNGAHGLNEG
jgi:CRISPR-associated protein Cmr2